eukprot:SAG31_NODE_2033_length_6618_cov_3.628624_6_plen_246_part_00
MWQGQGQGQGQGQRRESHPLACVVSRIEIRGHQRHCEILEKMCCCRRPELESGKQRTTTHRTRLRSTWRACRATLLSCSRSRRQAAAAAAAAAAVAHRRGAPSRRSGGRGGAAELSREGEGERSVVAVRRAAARGRQCHWLVILQYLRRGHRPLVSLRALGPPLQVKVGRFCQVLNLVRPYFLAGTSKFSIDMYYLSGISLQAGSSCSSRLASNRIAARPAFTVHIWSACWSRIAGRRGPRRGTL